MASVTRIVPARRAAGRRPTSATRVIEALEPRALLNATLATADNVGALAGSRAYSGTVAAGDDDFRRFRLSARAVVTLSVSGAGAQAQLVRDYDADGAIDVDAGEVRAATAAGEAPAVYSATAGTYYLRVFSTQPVAYSLAVTADAAGSRVTSARDLGEVAAPRSLADGVGAYDVNDYYRFSVAGTATVRAVVSGLSGGANADLKLIQDVDGDGVVDRGETLAASANAGSLSDSFTRTVGRGTYYLLVKGVAGTANYNLSLSADLAGASLATPGVLRPVNGRTVINEFVGASDRFDVWRFNLPATGTLSATLTRLTGDADLRLIRDLDADGIIDDGEVLAYSVNSGTRTESISTSLLRGTFYLRVQRSSGEASYRLTITSDPAGNLPAAARQLGTLGTGTASYRDFLGAADANDFYRFTLSGARTFSASLGGLSADADLLLFRDANANGAIDSGETLALSANDGLNGEVISLSLAAGTYYLRVFDPVGDGNYDLAISATD